MLLHGCHLLERETEGIYPKQKLVSVHVVEVVHLDGENEEDEENDKVRVLQSRPNEGNLQTVVVE